MEQDQEQQVPDIVQEQEEQPAEEVAPTKSVKNFWERLDEVFKQNTDFKDKIEDILEQFPEVQKVQGEFKSFIFQPERVSLCSNDDVQPSSTIASQTNVRFSSSVQGHSPAERFSNFRIRLKRPLRNVKSVQLLSAVVPNAIQNIPDEQTFFFWYKLRSVALANLGAWSAVTTYSIGDIVSFLGNTFVSMQANNLNYQPTGGQIGIWWKQITLPADTTRPNYYDLNYTKLNYLWLNPTFGYPPEILGAGFQLLFNRTFQDYNDLVNSLNFIMLQNNYNNNAQNDISFEYNEFLNKVIMVPNPDNITAGYYYLPCGYEDPNIPLFFASGTLIYGPGNAFPSTQINFVPQTILNTRLGFTWNGIFPNPFLQIDPWSDVYFQGSVYWYLRQKDPAFFPIPPGSGLPPWGQNVITFNNYPDLVNTSCVRIYADFAFSSTQDSLGSTNTENQSTPQGLLSIVPINATNLGVGFYQNNFNNELTKIPDNLTEIGITMLNDQGLPFYLPNSATVLLELGITYH